MAATTATLAGYSPDSVYAEQSAEEREITDRMEAESNDRQSTTLAVADEQAHHPVRNGNDDSLRRSAKRLKRELEDLADGELADSSTGYRRRKVEAELNDVETEQAIRATLAETWQASEDGTHSYTDFQGRGGLSAVLHHGATPPSYYLAALLDWEQFKLGKLHVLGWGEEA